MNVSSKWQEFQLQECRVLHSRKVRSEETSPLLLGGLRSGRWVRLLVYHQHSNAGKLPVPHLRSTINLSGEENIRKINMASK